MRTESRSIANSLINNDKAAKSTGALAVAHPVTFVSGYWRVKGKHSHDEFCSWFPKTLSIRRPYVFFGNQESIAIAKRVRNSVLAPTVYIQLELADFYTYRWVSQFATHPVHAPSAEVQVIWHEKIFLLARAAALNFFHSEWFMWVDAGISPYRHRNPPDLVWPSDQESRMLPRKFVFTSSIEPVFRPAFFPQGWEYHFVAGSAYMLPKELVVPYAARYREILRQHVSGDYIDQHIHTFILKSRPDWFYRAGHGYGTLLDGGGRAGGNLTPTRRIPTRRHVYRYVAYRQGCAELFATLRFMAMQLLKKGGRWLAALIVCKEHNKIKRDRVPPA